MFIEKFESLDAFKTFKATVKLKQGKKRKSNILTLIEVVSIMTHIMRLGETLVFLLSILQKHGIEANYTMPRH